MTLLINLNNLFFYVLKNLEFNVNLPRTDKQRVIATALFSTTT